MPTSPTTMRSTSFLHEVESGEPIPAGKMAYFEQRALNNFYAFVVGKFLKSGLRKSDLARRINLSQPQLNRYLASPGNWTVATIQRLLVGIAGEEAFLDSTPFSGRTPKNLSMIDLLDDPDPPGKGAGNDAGRIELKLEPARA